jgi:type VI secretion system protein ImpA
MASAATGALSKTAGPEIIDVDALIAPLPGDNPAGESLQYAGLYDEIREARRQDEDLVQGEWKRDRKIADWPEVVSLATEALATRTKDLQVAAWLAEALVKTRGFYGLREGLKIVRLLLERFWDNLYPESGDDHELEARVNALAWMDRPSSIGSNSLVLPKAIRDVAISNSITGLKYSYLQWEQSREFDIPESLDDLDSDDLRRISEVKQRAEEEDKITSEQWRVAKAATPRDFYEETYSLLNQCWEEFHALDQVIDGKFGRYAPGLTGLKKTLDDVRGFVEKIVLEKRILEPDPVTEHIPEPAAAASLAEVQMRTAGGVVQTRQEALGRLAEVADYFRRVEPHSPVSYLVQRAIRWGQMPLEMWLEDVIKNDGVLEQLRETLGFNTRPGRGSTEDGS